MVRVDSEMAWVAAALTAEEEFDGAGVLVADYCWVMSLVVGDQGSPSFDVCVAVHALV